MSVRSRPARRGAGSFALGVVVAAVSIAMAAPEGPDGDSPPAPTTVYRIMATGAITPATGDYIATAIAEAERAEAAALVIVLDTPGGLLDSTKTIVQDLLGAKIPIVVYVSPGGASATSAGVFVTMAAHVAAMAPGTSIGAAHPVGGQGQDIEGHLGKKVENFTAAFGSSIAERRGRNVEWAAKAVRESVTATESEAVTERVVDFIADDLAQVLEKASGLEIEVAGETRTLDLRGAVADDGTVRVVDVEMSLRQRVVALVSDPNIAYLLMTIGMLGLYFELSNPGLVLPGVVGAICLLLALLASQVLPITSAGAMLLALGMALLLAETFFPSFGTLGVGGIVAVALGSLFLFSPDSSLQVDRRLIAGTVGTMGALVAFVAGVVVRDRRRQPHTGSEGLVGKVGVALTDIGRSGKVRLQGEIWNASSRAPIGAGCRVRVEQVEGLVAKVTALPEGEDV